MALARTGPFWRFGRGVGWAYWLGSPSNGGPAWTAELSEFPSIPAPPVAPAGTPTPAIELGDAGRYFSTYGTGIIPARPSEFWAFHHCSSGFSITRSISPLLNGRSSSSLPGKSKSARTYSSSKRGGRPPLGPTLTKEACLDLLMGSIRVVVSK